MTSTVNPHLSVVSPITAAEDPRRAETAGFLRELADKVEAGSVEDFVCAYDDREVGCYATFVNFEDRWRILAALEYAKNSACAGGAAL